MSIILLARRLVSVDLLTAAWRTYLSALERRPCRTHAINTCVLMGAGDVIAQVVLERRGRRNRRSTDAASSTGTGSLQPTPHPETLSSSSYDFVRTARFCFVGLTMAGPSMHVWYRALDRVFQGTGLRSAVRKTVADQLLFLPVYLAVFVGVMAGLRGDRPADIVLLLRRDMTHMLAASYAVWPAVQLVNFRFVPLRHRILVINVVCLFWNTYIGWRAEKKHTSEL